MTEDPAAGSHLTPKQRKLLDGALEQWNKFLTGVVNELGAHDIHLLALGPMQGYSGPPPPPNLNRYLTRSVEIDIVAEQRSAFVFCRLGPVCFLGFIQRPETEEWEGTEIALAGGWFDGKASVPGAFGDYLNDRAAAEAAAHKKMSAKQRKKIEETMKRDLDRVVNSESFRAMEQDVEMAGHDAVFGSGGDTETQQEPKS